MCLIEGIESVIRASQLSLAFVQITACHALHAAEELSTVAVADFRVTPCYPAYKPSIERDETLKKQLPDSAGKDPMDSRL